MAKRLAVALAMVGCIASLGVAQDQAPGFQIVVNASNSAPALSKKQVARLFLKKELNWPSGFGVLPVDQRPNAAVRKHFSQEVLDKKVGHVQSYWRRALFAGLDVPPVELESDAKVLEFVSSNAGAIGYIGAETPLTEGVRVLEVKP